MTEGRGVRNHLNLCDVIYEWSLSDLAENQVRQQISNSWWGKSHIDGGKGVQLWVVYLDDFDSLNWHKLPVVSNTFFSGESYTLFVSYEMFYYSLAKLKC